MDEGEEKYILAPQKSCPPIPKLLVRAQGWEHVNKTTPLHISHTGKGKNYGLPNLHLKENLISFYSLSVYFSLAEMATEIYWLDLLG